MSRYAIYYAPPAGVLADFAARWLGWDAAAGSARAHAELAGLPLPVAELTAAPRKYGFHGTLKAPFRLADGMGEPSLRSACAWVARRLAPVSLPGLRLARLGGFLALVPEGDAAPLASLAAEVVTALDAFRAPPNVAEIARRKPEKLTEAQGALLARWGYPYVLGEFRFHLTLTGNLPPETAAQVLAVLEPHLAPLLPRPFEVADFCLFGEAEDGKFKLLQRYPLGG
jgi:putative phosphonate metabolism protein